MLNIVVNDLREHIQFDALIAGSGFREEGGSVTISEVLGCHGVSTAFIEGYPAVAQEDVVGQLFAAYPRIVQVISVEDYRNLGKAEEKNADAACEERIPGARGRKRIADYLAANEIRHLMLAGLDSSFGLAWITFYRKDYDKPFTSVDAEWAKYLVPSILYKWQHHVRGPHSRNVELSTRLLPLTAREMQVAILDLEGIRTKVIADRLQLSESYVQTIIKNIRTRLGICGRKMTVQDLESYGAAV